MNLNMFATQLMQSGVALNGQGAAALGTPGLGGEKGLAFWNVILGSIDSSTPKDDCIHLVSCFGPDSSGNNQSIKQQKADLALLQLALLGQDTDVDLDQKLAELRIERIANNPQNRVEQLTKLINHLTSGLITGDIDNNIAIEELVSRLEHRLEKLEASLEAFRTGDFGDEGMPFQMLIATGLDPAKLTKITNRIEEIETKLGRELTVEDLIAGVGNIIPVPGSEDEEYSAADALALLANGDIKADTGNDSKTNTVEEFLEEIVESKNGNNISNEEKENKASVLGDEALETQNTGQIISAEVKNIASGEKQNFVNETVLSMLAAKGIAPAGKPFNGLQPASEEISSDVIAGILPQTMTGEEFLAMTRENGALNQENGGLIKAAAKAIASLKANLGMAATANTTLPTEAKAGTLTLPFTSADGETFSLIMSETLGFDIESGMPFNNTIQAAHSISSSSSHAGQTHPATSMVAANISKAAQNGDTSNITLQLDPPDLGRVEVRLEFGMEKTVKAHLIVEKPETYLMLQRDAHALEKALQDAGLDTDSGSLNYEMAAENYAFDSRTRGENSNTNNTDSNADSGENSEEIIETSMTWDVNPETGHVHYSILA